MMIMTIFNDQFCFAQNRPKNTKMWKFKILDTFSMTFWLRTKFLGPAKIQNWTSGSVLEIQNSWLLVVEGAAELCRLILLISDHPIQQGYYKFWNQLFSGTPCKYRSFSLVHHWLPSSVSRTSVALILDCMSSWHLLRILMNCWSPACLGLQTCLDDLLGTSAKKNTIHNSQFTIIIT